MQAQGHASPIGSSQLPVLDSLVCVVEQWLQGCGKAIARRSAQTLKTCLEAMAASVQRAQEQMESQLRKLQASHNADSGPWEGSCLHWGLCLVQCVA